MIVNFFTREGITQKQILYVRVSKDNQSTEIKLDFVPQKNKAKLEVFKEKVREELVALYNEQLLKSKPADPKTIKQLYLLKTKPRYLLETYWEYVTLKVKPRVEKKEIAATTLQKYTVVYNHLKDFLDCRNLSDINLLSIDREFIDDFENFLRQFNGHNATMKHLAYVKMIMRYSVDVKGYILRNPFEGVKLAKKKNNPVVLEEDELKQIINKTSLVPRVSQVKDLFLFQCFTGLAFIDMVQLRKEHIIDGLYIKSVREKTGEKFVIYLYTPAKMILEKYHYQLPIISNQKMNQYLKELADVCDVRKKLTTHVARHTFATTINLNNGVPLQVVQSLLGHSSIKQTEHYAKLRLSSVLQYGQSNNSKLSIIFDLSKICSESQ